MEHDNTPIPIELQLRKELVKAAQGIYYSDYEKRIPWHPFEHHSEEELQDYIEADAVYYAKQVLNSFNVQPSK